MEWEVSLVSWWSFWLKFRIYISVKQLNILLRCCYIERTELTIADGGALISSWNSEYCSVTIVEIFGIIWYWRHVLKISLVFTVLLFVDQEWYCWNHNMWVCLFAWLHLCFNNYWQCCERFSDFQIFSTSYS